MTTPEKKKKIIIYNWKRYGIICNYDEMYEKYLNTNTCDFCKKEIKMSRNRCLDHDHNITNSYNVRGVLCRRCNFKDVLKTEII